MNWLTHKFWFSFMLSATIVANIAMELGIVAFWAIPGVSRNFFNLDSPGAFMMIGLVIMFFFLSAFLGIFLGVIIIQHSFALIKYLKRGEIHAADFVVSTYAFYYIGFFAFILSVTTIVGMIEEFSLDAAVATLIANTYFLSNCILTIWASIKINRTQKAVYHPIKRKDNMIPSEERN